MVEANANLVRWMHVTPWKQDVESCDRVGLMQAMPAGDAERDVDGRRWEQRVEVMRDAIIYNRNNPSIIFYESGNKGISEAHMRRDEGAPRQVRSARRPRRRLPRDARQQGRRVRRRDALHQQERAACRCGRRSIRATKACANTGTNSRRRSTKTATARLTATLTASAYNRNQDSHAIENVVRWYDYWEARPGTGKRVSSGGVNIIFSDTNTHHRGAENYRRSGEVDAMRIPKDGFFAHQVMWDGWVDVERRARTSSATGTTPRERRKTSTSFRAPTRSSCFSTEVARLRRAKQPISFHIQECRMAARRDQGRRLFRKRKTARPMRSRPPACPPRSGSLDTSARMA